MNESLPDINQGISKPDLFEKFKIQLQKDFETCGLKADFCQDLKPDYEYIYSKISGEIRKISKNFPGKLNELLYRIDVSELQIKKLTKQKQELELDLIISELIIKRELQKIVYKEFFKGND